MNWLFAIFLQSEESPVFKYSLFSNVFFDIKYSKIRDCPSPFMSTFRQNVKKQFYFALLPK